MTNKIQGLSTMSAATLCYIINRGHRQCYLAYSITVMSHT